ncbi:MAG: hypothetical protein ACRC46_06195 [Thermoguttaceae bacterium]
MDAGRSFGAVAFLVCLAACLSGVAASPRSPWERTMRVKWQNAIIVDAMNSLAGSLKTSLVIDRRVDTEIRLTFSAEGTVTQVLEQGLAPHGLALFTTDSLGYIARSEDIASLAHRIDEATKRCEQLPTKSRATLSKTTPAVTVPHLSDPRETLADIARKNKLTWRNLDELPHDRWRETVFPPMPLAQLLTIILAGFDATWDIDSDGKTLVIVRRN